MVAVMLLPVTPAPARYTSPRGPGCRVRAAAACRAVPGTACISSRLADRAGTSRLRAGPAAGREERGVKAVVWHGVGVIGVEDVPDPVVRDPGDAYQAFDRREPGWTKVTLDLEG